MKVGIVSILPELPLCVFIDDCLCSVQKLVIRHSYRLGVFNHL